ncbi:MAG: hypothetical protein AAGC84_01480 [Pseudomonas sp.]
MKEIQKMIASIPVTVKPAQRVDAQTLQQHPIKLRCKRSHCQGGGGGNW